MSTVTRSADRALRRFGFTFAADGSHAACLAAGPDGGWYAESWRLPADGGPAETTSLPLPGGRTESLHTQLVALPDGRVLACRHDGEQHGLALLSTAPGDGREQQLARLWLPGLRLLPQPGGGAVALGSDSRPVTTVWRVTTDGTPPAPVAELPGLHGGGVWLDRTGRLLALDRVADGVVRTVVLDLESGAVTPLLEIGERSNDRLVLFDPDTGLGVVRSDAPGTDRLGWATLGSSDPVRFPDCLHAGGLLPRPVALVPGDPAGPRVVLQLDHGAGSALALWQPATARLQRLAVPPGRLGGVGHWAAGGLRIPYSAPDHPAALATLDVDALAAAGAAPATGAVPLPLQLAPLTAGTGPEPSAGPAAGAVPGWRLDGSAVPDVGGPWQGARLLHLGGAAGPVEAVVYGGDAWLTAPHLVLALHGGPADAWQLEFDPALQRIARQGAAVVAPNQRGSTGYGAAHAAAVHGAWGGPDLEDVLHLLEGLAGRRAALGLEPPAVFGTSYGAFLALLATAHAPAGHLARCAAVAPFLSGARLLAEAGASVRSMTARLGGDTPVHDARGPRDVLRLAGRLTAPLLVVHGDRDEVVPVGQSRELRHELLRLGRQEGTDFRYVEAAGGGHELLAGEGSAVLHELLAVFLCAGGPA
ncbi:hypothetical protein KNE206_13900 [Kitasatospora sp. NE20-6]|uniref:alpha/beta hydrolase family protein n=1 Tax=Kitasatospora sp. NE20-6 TaxID=2859066 RepID=UPI0034DB891B